MNKERLLKLADYLDTVPKALFDYDRILQFTKGMTDEQLFDRMAAHDTNCGAVACAIGWCPVVFPDLIGYSDGYVQLRDRKGYVGYLEVAQRLFDINYHQADRLFTPGMDDENCAYEDTHDPSLVANKIREFVSMQN